MRKFMVLDTEAAKCGTVSNGRIGLGAQVYDLGFVIADKTGRVYEHESLALIDQFANRAIMDTAYYADKLPQYFANGDFSGREYWRFVTTFEAFQMLWDAIKRHDVRDVWAYNARFDADALTSTIREASNNWRRWPLPYGVAWRDILPFARQTLCNSNKDRDFCKANGLMTKNGRARTSADAVGKFLRNDTGYNEEHTALSDAMDELTILCACFKRKKKQPERFNY